MNREQMIKRADEARLKAGYAMDPAAIPCIVDAILPQVSTVEELEALPNGVVLVSDKGFPYWLTAADTIPRAALAGGGPFTVVWRPEP